MKNKKEKSKIITVQSQLVGVSPLADNGMSLRFHTKEIKNNEKIIIMDKFQKTGWLLFKEDNILENEVPKDNTKYEDKTPSQRLRSVMFVYWRQFKIKKKLDDDFNSFYIKVINALIENYKSKLENY